MRALSMLQLEAAAHGAVSGPERSGVLRAFGQLRAHVTLVPHNPGPEHPTNQDAN